MWSFWPITEETDRERFEVKGRGVINGRQIRDEFLGSRVFKFYRDDRTDYFHGIRETTKVFIRLNILGSFLTMYDMI